MGRKDNLMRTVVGSSATSEWNTPGEHLDLVVKVLGVIDLDPCSNPTAMVPATRHFTVADDSLAQPWRGRIFMNPPYGRVITKWTQKFVQSYCSGEMTEGLALVPSRTDTKWFQHFYPHRAAICFIDGRLHFSGHKNSAPFPSALVYLGQRLDRFAEVFHRVGRIYLPYDQPQEIAKGAQGQLL